MGGNERLMKYHLEAGFEGLAVVTMKSIKRMIKNHASHKADLLKHSS
jgi:hypothetical protein